MPLCRGEQDLVSSRWVLNQQTILDRYKKHGVYDLLRNIQGTSTGSMILLILVSHLNGS